MTTGQRILLRAVSALVGLVVVAALLVGIGQIIAGLTAGDDFIIPTSDWYTNLRETPWNDQSVQIVGITAIVVGLLLITVAVVTRPRMIALRPPKDSVTVVISPRTVAQILRRQAESVPGVASASAEVQSGTARITASAPLAHPDRITQDLEKALSHGLKQIPWHTLPQLQIEISSDRGSATVTADSTHTTDNAAHSGGRP